MRKLNKKPVAGFLKAIGVVDKEQSPDPQQENFATQIMEDLTSVIDPIPPIQGSEQKLEANTNKPQNIEENVINTQSERNQIYNSDHNNINKIDEENVINTQSERNQNLKKKENVIKKAKIRNQNVINTESNTQSERNQIFSFFNFQQLAKTEQKILICLFNLCLENGNYITVPFRYIDISNYSQTTDKTAKNTITRLEKRLLIKRLTWTKGPGAKTTVKIFEDTYKVLLEKAFKYKNDPENVIRTESNTQSNVPSMYVGINNNTIHTEHELSLKQTQMINDPWKELFDVDFSMIEHFGIRSSIIDSFKKNKWVISREQLEEHIERFTRYFTEKEFEKRREPIKNPYSFFLGGIKAISKGEPDPICDVKTQLELAQECALKNKLKEMEIRRRELDAVEKQMDQFKESEFVYWEKSLTIEQKTDIAPPNSVAKIGSFGHKQLLKSYYSENIWPEVKHSVVIKT